MVAADGSRCLFQGPPQLSPAISIDYAILQGIREEFLPNTLLTNLAALTNPLHEMRRHGSEIFWEALQAWGVVSPETCGGEELELPKGN